MASSDIDISALSACLDELKKKAEEFSSAVSTQVLKCDRELANIAFAVTQRNARAGFTIGGPKSDGALRHTSKLRPGWFDGDGESGDGESGGGGGGSGFGGGSGGAGSGGGGDGDGGRRNPGKFLVPRRNQVPLQTEEITLDDSARDKSDEVSSIEEAASSAQGVFLENLQVTDGFDAIIKEVLDHHRLTLAERTPDFLTYSNEKLGVYFTSDRQKRKFDKYAKHPRDQFTIVRFVVTFLLHQQWISNPEEFEIPDSEFPNVKEYLKIISNEASVVTSASKKKHRKHRTPKTQPEPIFTLEDFKTMMRLSFGNCIAIIQEIISENGTEDIFSIFRKIRFAGFQTIVVTMDTMQIFAGSVNTVLENSHSSDIEGALSLIGEHPHDDREIMFQCYVFIQISNAAIANRENILFAGRRSELTFERLLGNFANYISPCLGADVVNSIVSDIFKQKLPLTILPKSPLFDTKESLMGILEKLKTDETRKESNTKTWESFELQQKSLFSNREGDSLLKEAVYVATKMIKNESEGEYPLNNTKIAFMRVATQEFEELKSLVDTFVRAILIKRIIFLWGKTQAREKTATIVADVDSATFLIDSFVENQKSASNISKKPISIAKAVFIQDVLGDDRAVAFVHSIPRERGSLGEDELY